MASIGTLGKRRLKHQPTTLFHSLGIILFIAFISVPVIAFTGLFSLTQAPLEFSLLQTPYIQSIILFTIKQAALSALFSIVLGYIIARSLFYAQPLFGQHFFLKVCLLCFVFPSLVLVTAFILIFGQNGWLTPYIRSWIDADFKIYGLHGILIAHIFLNMPLVTRIVYLNFTQIPDNAWRLTQQLKLSKITQFVHIELKHCLTTLLATAALIFSLCFNSFAIVLALGGGPQSTTLELAIYQALKFDFNIQEALWLAWLQLLLMGSFFLITTRTGQSHWNQLLSNTNNETKGHMPKTSWPWLHYIIYAVAWITLITPIVTLILRLATINYHQIDITLLSPVFNSVILGLVVALLSTFIAYGLLWPLRIAILKKQRHIAWLLDWLSQYPLVVPTMVLCVGIYVLLLKFSNIISGSLFWLITINCVITVPFAFNQLRARALSFDRQYRPLIANLKLSMWMQLKAEWVWLLPSLRLAFTLTLLLALGDIAVFSIIGPDSWTTLPVAIYHYASSYRLEEATVLSALLLVLYLTMFWLLQEKQDH